MKQQKNQQQTPPQPVPVKPQGDTTHPEDVKLSKEHPQDPPADNIEGEGSYTAARRYREGVEQSVQKGDSDKLAENAAEALDGPEGADLRHAEQRGKMTPPGVQDQQQGQQQQKQQGKPQRGGDKHQPTPQR